MEPTKDRPRTLRLSTEAQKNVLQFTQDVLTKHQEISTELVNKMDAIDIAYARYQESAVGASTNGVDVRAGATACDVFATDDNVIPPIVVAQVDSYVAYLADVFLSGTPLFPVVSSPAKRLMAEQLETLLDDHASIGGYARQLLMFLRDGAKYNFCAVEIDWSAITQFSVTSDFSADLGRTMKRDLKYYNKVRRLNPRNVIMDMAVLPGDISESGDFVGYVEYVSRTALKKELNILTAEGNVYNADKAIDSRGSPGGELNAYAEDPTISNYINSHRSSYGGTNWDSWFDPGGKKSNRRGASYGASYQRVVVYARIMPSDFGITAPQPNTPQIWKFIVINSHHVICAKRIISAYDYLPILIGQPLEDGLGFQTQSIAEGEIAFQDAASTLFNIRFAAARRSVSDRALYRADMIKPGDINSKAAAPKIPVNISALSNLRLGDAYQQIPFDMRGTESTIQDAATIVGFSKELHGLNGPNQGQFQKGNKSVTEWTDTMAGSNNRLRLPALTLEHQVFSPMKSLMTLNLFQYGDDIKLVSQQSGAEMDIKIDELRKTAMAFKLADGYTPRSKMASTEMLNMGMQMIGTSQVLQQAYGSSLPNMFAHLMTLGGVKGLEEYSPQAAPAPAASPDPAMGAPILPEAPVPGVVA